MTIAVEIKHTQLGYDKPIIVQEVSVGSTGEVLFREYANKVIVQPGKSTIKYVYGGQSIVVSEGTPEQLIKDAE